MVYIYLFTNDENETFGMVLEPTIHEVTHKTDITK